MTKKNNTQQGIFLGMEEFLEEEDDETIHEGIPRYNTRYFDATSLPDAPERQKVAHGNQSYTMYIVYPSYEDMCKGLEILTLGQRKNVVKGSTACTISSTAVSKITGKTMVKTWEDKLFQTIGEESTSDLPDSADFEEAISPEE